MDVFIFADDLKITSLFQKYITHFYALSKYNFNDIFTTSKLDPLFMNLIVKKYYFPTLLLNLENPI